MLLEFRWHRLFSPLQPDQGDLVYMLFYFHLMSSFIVFLWLLWISRMTKVYIIRQ
ncbi:unnamed protein product [Arabidopsis halleri]